MDMSACPEFSFSFQIGVALENLNFTEKLANVSAVVFSILWHLHIDSVYFFCQSIYKELSYHRQQLFKPWAIEHYGQCQWILLFK